MTIIKIHGCSGAGKTTAVRELMARSRAYDTITHEFPRDKGKPIQVPVYRMEHPGVVAPISVIGKYGENWCGGVDTISDWRHAWQLVEQYAPQGHVIFEGLLQSTYYGSMGELSRRYGSEFVYAFLNTPVEVCLGRVHERRAKAGSKTKFNPQNTVDKWDTIARLKDKLEAGGYHRVATLDWRDPIPPQLVRLLNGYE